MLPLRVLGHVVQLHRETADRAREALRHVLDPANGPVLVTRLACADTWPVERERAAYISSWAAGRHTFEQGLKILEGALAIGRQAEAPAPDAVKTRMDLVQNRATTPTSVADSAVFSKIKSWLLATKQTEGTA